MREGHVVYLQAALPSRKVVNAGVVLLDPDSDKAYIRCRQDWRLIAEDDDREVFEYLESDLQAKEQEWGGKRLVDWIQDTLSNTIRCTDLEVIRVSNFEGRLRRLYDEHVRPHVLQFETHLPVWSLRAAAGHFGGEMEAEPEGWTEVRDLTLSRDMFVAHVSGRSMEPRIPDGSLCVFRYGVAGSRTNRLVLVENFGASGEGRYTIKRYRRVGAKVILEPLNPEFEAWELGEGDFRVIAEFVRVLDE
jgi:SOS-response transcriptional repressor LexA